MLAFVFALRLMPLPAGSIGVQKLERTGATSRWPRLLRFRNPLTACPPAGGCNSRLALLSAVVTLHCS